VYLHCLIHEDQVYDQVVEYVAVVEKKFRQKVKYLRFGNAKEFFLSQRLKDWAITKGITIEMTAPYSPLQNGIAERFNRTLLELAWVMIIAKNLPAFLTAQ
jgi:hypothetical protein